jgi:hypothetical protein
MFMANLLIEIVGWIGAALVVIAYFLITYKKLDRESKIYHAMNLVGGLLTGVNAVINQAYPSAAINVMWVVVAIYGLIEGLKS